MDNNLLPLESKKLEIATKKQSETNPEQGCIPEKRKLKDLIEYGIININKPPGPTSHQTADFVKKILNLNKSGHSGTLDPKVTGVLPIALSKATRIVQMLLPAGKEYIALMRLHSEIPKEEIKKTFRQFTGDINQLPPVKSAVKRRIRKRTIYYSEILEIKEKYVLFKVGCQAGTYIRKLIHDMGRSLKTGAHMAQLVRTKAGPFKSKNWHTLQDLKDAYEIYKETKDEKELRKIILPFEEAIKFTKKIWVLDSAVSNICHGAPLAIQGISKYHKHIKKGDLIAIVTLKNELIGLGESVLTSEKIGKEKEGIAVKTNKIFMERNTYSK
jgi:H/ACA ribonucleoprotein complex subunit 4